MQWIRNGVEIDSEFWERGFVLSLGSENRINVAPIAIGVRFFKVQNEDLISCQDSESIFSPFLSTL